MTALQSGLGDVVRTYPKPKKRKASPLKAALAYCDKWCRAFIKARDHRCVTCGAPAHKEGNVWWVQCVGSDKILPLDWSHVFRKSNSYAVRWDVRNVYAQGRACHWKHHQHEDPALRNYAFRRVGQKAMDDLWLQSKAVSKFSADTIRAFGDSFRVSVKEMERWQFSRWPLDIACSWPGL